MLSRIIFLTILILASSHNVMAANQDNTSPQNNFVRGQQSQDNQPRISRTEASDIAREAFNARILSIRLDRGRWRMRLDQDGNVFDVLVNASSGEVSRPAE